MTSMKTMDWTFCLLLALVVSIISSLMGLTRGYALGKRATVVPQTINIDTSEEVKTDIDKLYAHFDERLKKLEERNP